MSYAIVFRLHFFLDLLESLLQERNHRVLSFLQKLWEVGLVFGFFYGALYPSFLLFLTLFLLLSGTLFLHLLVQYVEHLQEELRQTDRHFTLAEKKLREKFHRLLEKSRLLSTLKEVSRVVNDDTQLENILEKVFSLLEQVSHCEEIVIWLLQEQKPGLIPRARRRNRTSFFQEDLHREDVDSTLVNECFEQQKVFRYSEGALVHLCFPLVADHEALGVLNTTLWTTGTESQRFKQILEFEEDFEGLLKHLSLAIKKPTLYDRAVLDGLTGLFSRRHIKTQLASIFHQAKRNPVPFSLLLIDIDHFKKVNDNHGHLTGDMVLQQVAQVIKNNLRKSDSAYRYGGEELLVLVPETRLEAAILFGERVRKAIEDKNFDTEHTYTLKVTTSIGIAEFHSELTDYLQIISRADQGLYLAKHSGRNRLGVFQDQEKGPRIVAPEEVEVL
jgi:diguanylate cyclase (GGDEF)-like protein